MGSIQKRGENTYLLTVSGGFGLNGKRQRHTKTVEAKDEKSAAKQMVKFEQEVEANNYIKPDKMTFESFATEWLAKYAKPNLEGRTYERYKEILDSRVIPAFRKLRLEQIKPMHLMEFYENLKEDGIRLDGKKGGLSEQTVKHHHRLICTMFNHAVEWQMIANNPASRVKVPKVTQKEISHYDQEQIMTLIHKLNLAPTKYMTMVMISIFTGMRRGELMGLTWDDINFDGNVITIHQASQYIRGEGVTMKQPKNKFSKRKISVPVFITELLSAHKIIQSEDILKLAERHENNNLVFSQVNGKPMHPDTITSWFVNFIKDQKLPHITFHGLRHSHATILLFNNTDIVTVSRRLGHNRTSTTIDIYGHAIENSEKSSADKLENLLLKTQNCQQTVNKTKKRLPFNFWKPSRSSAHKMT